MTYGQLFLRLNPNVKVVENGTCVWIYFDSANHDTFRTEWWSKEIPDEALKAQEPGWISVKDRMPEYDKNVLIYAVGKTTNEPKIAISYLLDKFYFGSRPINLEEPIWHEPWQYFRAYNTITHWMPLPEPPKEEI